VFSLLVGAWRQIKSWLVDVEERQFAKKSWAFEGAFGNFWIWTRLEFDGLWRDQITTVAHRDLGT